MRRMRSVPCALVPCFGIGLLALAVALDGTSDAASSAAPAQTPVPGYIAAERAPAEQSLGAARADEVFSDRLTPLRKRLIAASLRANPAPGCAQPPVFTLEIVAPLETTADA